MEAQFIVNEESINDLVQRAVQRSFEAQACLFASERFKLPVKPLEAVRMKDSIRNPDISPHGQIAPTFWTISPQSENINNHIEKVVLNF